MQDNPTKTENTTNNAGIADRSARLSWGRFMLWAAFWVGLAVHVVEVFWMFEGIRQMQEGSCTAALIGLWFGLPLVPVALIAFVAGAVLAKQEDRKAWRAGLIGALLSVIAIPFWIIIALCVAEALGLG